jgi:hypothetical protein
MQSRFKFEFQRKSAVKPSRYKRESQMESASQREDENRTWLCGKNSKNLKKEVKI